MCGLTFCASLARWHRAQASLKATPAPHSPPNGIEVPGRRGWTMAAACGQRVAQLVMVGDDQLQAQSSQPSPPPRRWRCRSRPRSPSTCLAGQLLERVVVQPVAFVEPIGHVVADIGAQQSQAAVEQAVAVMPSAS